MGALNQGHVIRLTGGERRLIAEAFKEAAARIQLALLLPSLGVHERWVFKLRLRQMRRVMRKMLTEQEQGQTQVDPVIAGVLEALANKE